MAHSWTKDRSTKRIKAWLEQVKTVTIKDYVRETNLNDLAVNTAYRVEGVHLYVDILNIGDMLATTADEGVTCHRRTLRFLNLHFRAVQRILSEVEAIEVDFHNQRLHAVFGIRSAKRVVTACDALSQARAHGRAKAEAGACGARGMGEASRAVA